MAQDVFYSNTNDGHLNTLIMADVYPFSNARDATGSFNSWYSPEDDATVTVCGADLYGASCEYCQVEQAFLEFSTATLPDDAIIDSVYLSLVCQDGGTSTTINVYGFDWGGTLSNSTSIWRTKAQLDAMTLLATASTSSWSANTRYTLTSQSAMLSAINKTGVTRFIVVGAYNQASSFPPCGDPSYETFFYTANKSGQETYHPRLIVNYDVATIPSVTTTYITSGNIDMNHAHGGGNVTSDGGASVTARGNVWDKIDTTPDYPSDAYSSDGSGTGAFSSTLTPLNMGRLYYYRAYAVNSEGTGYGSVYSLTTNVPEPDPLEADEAELLIPTIAVTSVIPVTIELTNALNATGGIYGADVAIGLPKPELTLSLPNVTDIRVSWSGSIYGTTYYINDNYDDCMALAGYTLTFENLQPGDNDGMSTHIGMRFYNVAIPKDATIVSARLRFVCDVSYSNNDCNLVVKGENNATPATFSTLGDFEGRSRTTAYQNWDAVEGWTADEVYYSPDFAPVVSEITSLAGWVSGNYMVIFVENNSSDYYCMRQAFDYADAPGLAPRLEVEWV